MGELIVRDDRELRRLKLAIAALEARPGADRLRMQALLQALHTAHDAIEKPSRRPGAPRRAQLHAAGGLAA
jgi:hypothetical protein